MHRCKLCAAIPLLKGQWTRRLEFRQPVFAPSREMRGASFCFCSRSRAFPEGAKTPTGHDPREVLADREQEAVPPDRRRCEQRAALPAQGPLIQSLSIWLYVISYYHYLYFRTNFKLYNIHQATIIHLFPGEDWNRLLLQSPVKDVKTLKFSWVLPWQAPLWRKKPKAYATHLLGHEGAGSLTAVLKEKGLITSCASYGGGWLEGAFSLLHVQFALADSAVMEVEEIGKLLFTYIGMLQRLGVKEWILDAQLLCLSLGF